MSSRRDVALGVSARARPRAASSRPRLCRATGACVAAALLLVTWGVAGAGLAFSLVGYVDARASARNATIELRADQVVARDPAPSGHPTVFDVTWQIERRRTARMRLTSASMNATGEWVALAALARAGALVDYRLVDAPHRVDVAFHRRCVQIAFETVAYATPECAEEFDDFIDRRLVV